MDLMIPRLNTVEADEVDIALLITACYMGGPETMDLGLMIERVNDICSLFWIWE